MKKICEFCHHARMKRDICGIYCTGGFTNADGSCAHFKAYDQTKGLDEMPTNKQDPAALVTALTAIAQGLSLSNELCMAIGWRKVCAEAAAQLAEKETTPNEPKLEAAIAYFEDAIRESDEIIAECSPDLQAELTEQKAHFAVAMEAMRAPLPDNKALTPKITIVSRDIGDVSCRKCGHLFFRCFRPGIWNETQRSRKFCVNCGQELDWSDCRPPEKGA